MKDLHPDDLQFPDRSPHQRVVLSLWHGLMLVPSTKTWREVTTEVAEKYGSTLDELVGYNYRRRLGPARQEAWAIIHKLGRNSLPAIGRRFGGRDHTTVLSGIRKYYKRLEENAQENDL